MKKKVILLIAPLMLIACGNQQHVRTTNIHFAEVKPVKQQVQTVNKTDSVDVVGFNQNADVQKFIDDAVKNGSFHRNELEDFFNAVQYKSSIINIMKRLGTSRPWHEFQKANSDAARINAGKRFYLNNKKVIDDVAQRYGVPAEIIVAIIGIETNYGVNTGTFRVADALSTLAFAYPRRADFFQQELREFLLLAKAEKKDIFSFQGSYAGAMGMPQFMPSSFRHFAVDYDQDGYRDIWNNIGDVCASVANYIQSHNWQNHGKMVIPVTLTINEQLQSIIDEKTALTRTVADFKRLGVMPQQYVADDEKAILYRLETRPGVYEYYLGLNNFYVIWQYNHSRMYATSVRDIANGIMGYVRL